MCIYLLYMNVCAVSVVLCYVFVLCDVCICSMCCMWYVYAFCVCIVCLLYICVEGVDCMVYGVFSMLSILSVCDVEWL